MEHNNIYKNNYGNPNKMPALFKNIEVNITTLNNTKQIYLQFKPQFKLI